MPGTVFILSLSLLSPIFQAVTLAPPKTPTGLSSCRNPLQLERGFPRGSGEQLTYHLKMFGLQMGTANFSIKRRGRYDGRPVTEYGLDIDSTSLFRWLADVEGSGATLIEDGRSYPIQAASRYRFRRDQEQEIQTYSRQGHHVHSERHRNGNRVVREALFPTPVQDFLTGFYFLRSLKPQDEGCTILYSGHKAFTLWIHPEAEEVLKTANGKVGTTRYRLRYGSERDKLVKTMYIWISNDSMRIPLKIAGLQRFKPQAILEHYRPPRR